MKKLSAIRSKFINKSRKVLNLFLALFFIVALAGPMVPKVSAASLTATPRISFTFDDGMTSANTLAASALKAYGYTGTDYVISGCVGMTTAPNTCHANTENTYMTAAQIVELQNTYGWEIGAHTVTHPYLASFDATDGQPAALTPSQEKAEIDNSQTQIAAITGKTPTAFATPYGDYQPSGTPILSDIAQKFTSHRGFGDTGYNTFPYNDYLLRDQQVQGGVSVATVQGYINTAVSTNSWLILTFHNIMNGNASTDPTMYQYNVADLSAIAAYARSINLQGVNVSDGISANSANLFANPTFDTAISTNKLDYNSWSTDSPANIFGDTASNGSYPSPTNSVQVNSGASGAAHMFSPIVAVTAKPYVVKAYVNIKNIDPTTGEIAFFVEEYSSPTAAGYKGLSYVKAQSVFAVPNPLVKEFTFVYTPSAGTTYARLQISASPNTATGIPTLAYLDNIQMFAEDGTTTGPSAPVGVVTAGSGDLNGDGKVDIFDLSILSSNWQKATGATAAQGDLNGDGKVDIFDLSIMSTNWSK